MSILNYIIQGRDKVNIEKDIEDLIRKIDNNAKKIENNFEKIQQNSCALEILKDYKTETKRLYRIILLLICAIIILGIHHLIGC